MLALRLSLMSKELHKRFQRFWECSLAFWVDYNQIFSQTTKPPTWSRTRHPISCYCSGFCLILQYMAVPWTEFENQFPFPKNWKPESRFFQNSPDRHTVVNRVQKTFISLSLACKIKRLTVTQMELLRAFA